MPRWIGGGQAGNAAAQVRLTLHRQVQGPVFQAVGFIGASSEVIGMVASASHNVSKLWVWCPPQLARAGFRGVRSSRVALTSDRARPASATPWQNGAELIAGSAQWLNSLVGVSNAGEYMVREGYTNLA